MEEEIQIINQNTRREKFKNQIKLGNKYNEIVLSYEKKNNQNTEEELIDIIQKKDPTYSPLALNFIICLLYTSPSPRDH